MRHGAFVCAAQNMLNQALHAECSKLNDLHTNVSNIQHPLGPDKHTLHTAIDAAVLAIEMNCSTREMRKVSKQQPNV